MSTPLVLLAAAYELPAGEDWLGPTELATLRRFHVPKRRRDFRLGRFAAKGAMALFDPREGAFAPPRFEIRPIPGGAPRAFRDGAPLAVALSISHSHGWASAAVQPGNGRLGCDLERIEARSSAFLEDYLTPRERAFVAKGSESENPLRATLVWSAKEAVMKALGEGLRLSPTSVEVAPAHQPTSEAGWRRFSVLAPRVAANLQGFWQPVGPFVLTVADGPREPRLVGPLPEAAARGAPTSGPDGRR